MLRISFYKVRQKNFYMIDRKTLYKKNKNLNIENKTYRKYKINNNI